jgi:Icc-related predicted phosphoesterase
VSTATILLVLKLGSTGKAGASVDDAGVTRICTFADPHGVLPGVEHFPDADLYLLGGDVCPLSDHGVERQTAWLEAEFAPWVAELERRAPVVWVAGNHDFALADRYGTEVVRAPEPEPGTYLQDAAAEVEGVRVWGSPHSVFLPYWAFMWPEDGEEGFTLGEAWRRIDPGADALVVHGPPLGYGDLLADGERRVGSASLTERFASMDSRLLVCGHIHEGYGHWRLERDGRAPGLIVNASLMDVGYEMVNEPVLVELPEDPSSEARVLSAESGIGKLGLRAEW